MEVSAKARQLLDRARTRLVTDHPFFASIVLRYPLSWSDQLPTAGITPRGHIFINPGFIEPLNTQQVVFLLAHEACHYMGMHAMRKGHREHRKWNYANDAVINDMLFEAGIGEFIDGGVAMPGSRDKNSETVYAELPEQEDGSESFTLEGDIILGDGPGGGESPLSEGELQKIESDVKIAMSQAVAAAKICGHAIPEAIRRMVDDLLDIRTPWYTILERHFSGMKPDDTSWSRPNRRFIGMDLYLPGTDYSPMMGEVVLAIDTSGSIGIDELKHFISHIMRILEDCRPEKIHILFCDAAVRSAETFENVDDVEFNAKGGGGTAFKPVFDWVEEQDVFPDVLVYLTDLYGPTNFKAPRYPTFWLSTGEKNAPFGEVIPYEIAA